MMIVQRANLQRMNADMEAAKVRVYHFGLKDETSREGGIDRHHCRQQVFVLKADKWPYGKPMSAAELIQYIAKHVA